MIDYPHFVAQRDDDVATRTEVDAHPEYLVAIKETGWTLHPSINNRAVLKAPKEMFPLYGGYVSRRWLKTIAVAG